MKDTDVSWIRIYGGSRRGLGPYSVVMDNKAPGEYPGFVEGQEERFDGVLYQAKGLQPENHQIEIINTSNQELQNALTISHVSSV